MGKSTSAQSSFDGAQESGEAGIALGLQRLLQGIAMQHQCVGSEELDETAALGGAVTLIELNGTEIGKEQNAWGLRAHFEGRQLLGRLDERASRAQPHGQTVLLRDARQTRVDLARLRRAAGHARDKQRRGEPPAEKLARQVHVAEVDLGQRAVRERIIVKARGNALGRDVIFDIDAKVIGFARRGGRVTRHVARRTRQLLQRRRDRPTACGAAGLRPLLA